MVSAASVVSAAAPRWGRLGTRTDSPVDFCKAKTPWFETLDDEEAALHLAALVTPTSRGIPEQFQFKQRWYIKYRPDFDSRVLHSSTFSTWQRQLLDYIALQEEATIFSVHLRCGVIVAQEFVDRHPTLLCPEVPLFCVFCRQPWTKEHRLTVRHSKPGKGRQERRLQDNSPSALLERGTTWKNMKVVDDVIEDAVKKNEFFRSIAQGCLGTDGRQASAQEVVKAFAKARHEALVRRG